MKRPGLQPGPFNRRKKPNASGHGSRNGPGWWRSPGKARAGPASDLARRLERWETDGRPLAFLIGGSTGLDPDLVAKADARWSLGPLTLPHELARVVVAEQLYRAGTIRRGEPYHKGR